jgi:hypothetical protein
MKNKPIVSVVTAIGKLKDYNKFFERYIKNIKAQTIFDKVELIIVYMEWDSTLDKLKELPNVKAILDDEGRGMYNAWNIGVKNSTTDYITNWNIDDLRFADNLERKVNILEEDNNIDLVYNYYIASEDINEDYSNFDYNKKRSVEAYPDNAHEYVHYCCMCGPDPLWRRKIHNKIGYFNDEKYPSIADWEMWIRMAENGSKFKLIPEPLCLFYESSDSVSNKHAKFRDEVEKKRLFEQYQKGFEKQKQCNWERIKIAKDKLFSILILSLYKRKDYLDRLKSYLEPQLSDSIEVLYNIDGGEKSVGQKRNELLEEATGDYIAFVDDDDIISNDYVSKILKALKTEPDVIGIHLLHKEDGILRGLTYHSLKYDHWWDEVNKDNPALKNYYRNPNHLNPIKREYAIQVGFPQINVGEDRWYSENILKFLKTEEYIESPIYEYLVRTHKEC